MNLTHYTPYRLLGNLDEFLNQAFRGFGPLPASRAPGAYRYEDKNSYRLRLDLAGFSRDEISLSLEKGDLTVTVKSERGDAFQTDFERTYTLPDDVSAKLENGVLDVTFAKQTESEDAIRKIEIN